MIKDLKQARQTKSQQSTYRVGEFDLREPDYRLICLWAKDLGMAPQALLEVLAHSRFDPSELTGLPPVQFTLESGGLHSLVWDLNRLHRFPNRWVDGVNLHTLAFYLDQEHLQRSLAPKVPSLHRLFMSMPEFTSSDDQLCKLNLKGVPNLIELACIGIGLTKLDLSPVPALTKLYCQRNRLSKLDLSPVPKLTELDCSDNQLSQLNLSPVPELTKLNCGSNPLTNLDLSPVPRLTKLFCLGCKLTELDLSPVPALIKLSCWLTKLKELDLSPVPSLTHLLCERPTVIRNRRPELKIIYRPEIICGLNRGE